MITRRYFTLSLALLIGTVFLNVSCSTGNSGKQTAKAKLTPTSFTVMTFNLRYDNPDDGPNAWPKRTDIVAETIRTANPDIMGIQEGLIQQVRWIQENFPEYDSFGQGREGGEKGEHMTVFYRKSRFRPLKTGEFWLSDKPEQPGSMGWDAACTRMVTWVKLYDDVAQRELVAVNTHLDHRGKIARQYGSEMIVKFVAALPKDLPIVLTGDFNSLPSGMVHGTLTGTQPLDDDIRSPLRDAFYDNPRPVEKKKKGAVDAYWEVEPGTGHGFSGKPRPGGRIDWILISKHLGAVSHTIHDVAYEGRYPSDHFPVYATLNYR